MNTPVVRDTVTDRDDKIALIVDAAGATAEQAAKALDDNGGHVNLALSQLCGSDEEAPQFQTTDCDNLQPQGVSNSSNANAPPVAPGAVAVDGPEASRHVHDDEYTVTPQTETSSTVLVPVNPSEIVSAHLVCVTEQELVVLQNQVRQQGEQINQLRRERDSVAVGQVIEDSDAHDEEAQEEDNTNEEGGGADPGIGGSTSVFQHSMYNLCGGRRNRIVLIGVLVLVAIGAIVGGILSTRAVPTVSEPLANQPTPPTAINETVGTTQPPPTETPAETHFPTTAHVHTTPATVDTTPAPVESTLATLKSTPVPVESTPAPDTTTTAPNKMPTESSPNTLPPPTVPPTAPSSTSPPTSTLTVPPTFPLSTQQVLDSLTELLASVSLDGGMALQTPSTPQNDALNWLVGNAHLESYPDEKQIQRYVFAVVYYSTNGDGWTNNTGWLTDDDECTWYNKANDAFCTTDGVIVEFDLADDASGGNNLVGTLPVEVALLSNSLDRFSLGGNSLSGTIPSELGLLTSLVYLGLSSNSLTGTIPSEFGLLKSLRTLSLRDNGVTGTIPIEIGLLPSLNYLSLHSNDFTGEFTCPSFIDECYISCIDYTTDRTSPCRFL